MIKKPFVISVGNIAMGGTGKTPFTIFLAKHFLENERVAILSLGYKGKIGYRTNVISDGSKIFFQPPQAADEPYMIAQSLLGDENKPGVAVITGKDRRISYEYAIKNFNTTFFILDDGFQHKKMPRDLDILLLDHKKPLSSGFMFPFGYLREFPSAIKRADIIVFTRADSLIIPDKCKKYCEGKEVFFSSHYYPDMIVNEGAKDIKDFKNTSVYLMSAIANPNSFEKMLANLGITFIGHSKFRDHHIFSDKDLENVLKKAKNADYIITTQKDFVKISDKYKKYFIYPELKVKILKGDIFHSIEKYRT